MTKKQQKIIADMKEAINIDMSVLKDFNSLNNSDLVSSSQHSILEQLSGISSYIIFSTNSSVWDKRLSEAYQELRDMPELQLQYWSDCLERESRSASLAVASDGTEI